jgi:Ca-activated chloride channel homolog
VSGTNDFSKDRLSDDARLTAFALGELEGAERAEIEALVARDDAARRAVEEIRATAAVVTAELGASPASALTDMQRARIAAAASRRPPRAIRWPWYAAAASVAACAAVVFATRTEPGAEQSVGGLKAPTPRNGDGLRMAAELIDRASIPDKPPAGGGYAYGGSGGGGGKRTASPESGEFNPDPEAAVEMPSGATGGTSIGVGRVGHFGTGSPSAFASRRNGPGGGGGGLGQGPAAPPVSGGPGGPSTPGADQLKKLPSVGYIGGDAGDSTASYAHVEDNPFRVVKDAPLSTFGVDVDTASYSNVRRFLNEGRLPPPGAVRIEEMVNYFPYDYAPPTDGRPFAVRVDVAGCPWKTDHRLVRVGIKGKVVATAARPAANLVFLLDVSGSMQPAERLPLVLQSMTMLVGKLEARDRVAIVVYAGESGVALPSTSCEDKAKILATLDALHAGGSTNGAAGIQLAYDIAQQNRIEGGVNRVILATDGDFNVGVSDESSLVTLIEEKRKSGVFLSVLGVGTDNLKDAQMEKLADKGNGNYAYLDTVKEGAKVLVEQAEGTLVTIAKDVKLQVEFNPAQVGAWRLVGYENRVLAAEDFKDDKKDAGDIGAGHTVTALYEIVPPGVLTETAGVEPLKYQRPPAPAADASRELLTVKLRWKAPNADVSEPMEVAVVDEGASYSAASPDFKFAASVAAFGMCLRQSPHKGSANTAAVLELATEGAANDPGGYRREFVDLVKKAIALGAK